MSELMQNQYDEMLRLAETREIERDDAFVEMKRVRAERDALLEETAGWKADQKENLKNQCDLVAENAALRAFAQKILTEYSKDINIAVIAKECGLLRVDGDGQSEWIFNCLRPTPLLTGERQT